MVALCCLHFFFRFFIAEPAHAAAISERLLEEPRRVANATSCCWESFLFDPDCPIPVCCITFCSGTLRMFGSWCGRSPDSTKLRKSSTLLWAPLARPSSALSAENPVHDSTRFAKFSSYLKTEILIWIWWVAFSTHKFEGTCHSRRTCIKITIRTSDIQ